MKALSRFLALSVLAVALLAQAAEVDDLRRDRSARSTQIDRLKSQMFLYMLDHKLATASIIAAGGGLGAFLQENMDRDTRSAIMVIGLFGLAYCLDNWDNAKECASVTAELGSYAAKINNHRSAIDAIDSRLALLSRPTALAPQALPRPSPTDAPNTLSGSNFQGPFFNSSFPNGVYISSGAEIKLVLTTEANASRSMEKFDVAGLKKKAESAVSNLHDAADTFRYLLLEPDSLAVLKHSTRYRDYSELTDPRPGVGLEISKHSSGWTTISHVIRNSPASRTGIEYGDFLVSVGGKSTKDMNNDDVANLLRGDPGTSIDIVFAKPKEVTKFLEARIPRARVQYPALKDVHGYVAIYRDTKGKYFYVRNDRDAWHELPLGQVQTLQWNLDLASISVRFARPTTNADKHDREINYSFSVR